MTSVIADKILSWYVANKRQLPWRGYADPYAVWVSEIMLQQTRVETVIPYFQRWMNRYPTVQALAQAPQQEVLSSWEGLGYYSRARNLHRAAQLIVESFAGALPADAPTLQTLPGIGRYTAGAIASIAFGQDAPVLDGNIKRVFSRVFNITDPIGDSSTERRMWDQAKTLLPDGQAGDFNQALMDLGAIICVPKNPRCPVCPLNGDCLALQAGVQDERPVRKTKQQIPHYLVAAAVIRREAEVLIAQRPQKGLLGGLWEFPGGKIETDEDLIEGLKREIMEELGVKVGIKGAFGVYRHAYTHFRVTLHAFVCYLTAGEPEARQVADLKWVSFDELVEFPMGKIDRRIANRLTTDVET